MFYGQFIYAFSSPAIKLSLLVFYWKIFPTRTVRNGVYFLSFCCIGWFIGTMVFPFYGRPSHGPLDVDSKCSDLLKSGDQSCFLQADLVLLDPDRGWRMLCGRDLLLHMELFCEHRH